MQEVKGTAGGAREWEMSKRPGSDFPLGSTWHPDEAVLGMTAQDLNAIKDAAVQVAHQPRAHRFATFIIWNGPCRWEAAVQRARRITFHVFGRSRRLCGLVVPLPRGVLRWAAGTAAQRPYAVTLRAESASFRTLAATSRPSMRPSSTSSCSMFTSMLGSTSWSARRNSVQ